MFRSSSSLSFLRAYSSSAGGAGGSGGAGASSSASSNNFVKQAVLAFGIGVPVTYIGFQVYAGSKPEDKKDEKFAPPTSVDWGKALAPRPPKLVIFGAPASGKGTQCEKIIKDYGVVHISSGDMFREEIRLGTPRGLEAKAYMDRGELVPSSIGHAMMDARLKQPDVATNGFILDGFPREKVNSDFLVEKGHVPDLFIVIDVKEESLTERVVGRRKDPVTGKIYHLKFNPPPTPEIAARLIQRPDDSEATARKRIDLYNSQREASLAPFDKATVVVVDGNGSKEEVYALIRKEIDRVIGPAGLQAIKIRREAAEQAAAKA